MKNLFLAVLCCSVMSAFAVNQSDQIYQNQDSPEWIYFVDTGECFDDGDPCGIWICSDLCYYEYY